MAKTGGKREKATLKYEKEVYTPDGAKTLTNKELRAEYSRLRSIARKRLERFEGTEWSDTQIYKWNNKRFIPIKEIKSERDLRYLLTEVAYFIERDTSTVSGLEAVRRKSIQSLKEHGYDFISKENFKQFGEFMEYSRIKGLNRIYDSKRIAEFFEAQEKKKATRDELYKTFDKWIDEQREEAKIRNKNPRTSNKYRHDLD